MTVAALLKFQQGIAVGADGVAFLATAGTPVTIANSDNTNVVTWTFTLQDAPRLSALIPGTVLSSGPTSTVPLTGDVSGSYRIQLDVFDGSGGTARDIRDIVIPNTRGWKKPPFLSDDDEINYPDPVTPNARGWADAQEQMVDDLEGVANQTTVLAAASIVAGAGLTGGGLLNSSPTVNVGAGAGVVVNPNDVAVDFGVLGDVTTIQPGDTASAGVANRSARGDHRHAIAAGVPVSVDKSANAAGSATSVARSDHKHDVTTATPGTTTYGAAAEGTATSLARSDHAHAVTTPAAPQNVTKSAAAAGTATAFARDDHKHDVTTAVPGTVTFGAAAEGVASSLARSDHAHALTAPAAPADVTKSAASAGSSANVAREDHKHDVMTAVTLDVTSANAEGTASTLARSDHTHRVQKNGSAYTLMSTSITTGTSQPLSITDATMTGKTAGGSVASTGVVGVIAGSFASLAAETGTGSGQAGLGTAASASQPYNTTDFPGVHGIAAQLVKSDGSEIKLSDVLSTAPVADVNAVVFAFLSFRSDLGANLKWRAWFYYRRVSDGFFTPFTPDMSIVSAQLFVPEVFSFFALPVGVGLGIATAGQGVVPLTFGNVGDIQQIDAGDTASAGATGRVADAAHQHAVSTAIAGDLAASDAAAASAGVSTKLPRADHKHQVSTGTPGTITYGAASAGAASTLARSDHAHALTAPGVPADVTKAAASAGSSANVAREDHKHDISTAAASTIGAANTEGTATSLARSDHVHNHGSQTVGTMHAAVIADPGGTNGFMSSADKQKLDGVASGATNTTLSSATPADVTGFDATAGVAATASRSDHTHHVVNATKDPVRVAATGNLTLSGLAPVDGVAIIAGNRVLAPFQTLPEQGGIWVAAAGAWSRANDADTPAKLYAGITTRSTEGTTYPTYDWTLTNDVTVVGTTAQTWNLLPSKFDPAVVAVNAGAGTAGSNVGVSRGDHRHQVSANTSPQTVGTTNTVGTSTDLARADHVHAQGFGAADEVWTTNAAGNAAQSRKIVNANVATGAAIAGTKIAPDFGDQDVTFTTTGDRTIKPNQSAAGAGRAMTLAGGAAQAGSGTGGGNAVINAGAKDGAGVAGQVDLQRSAVSKLKLGDLGTGGVDNWEFASGTLPSTSPGAGKAWLTDDNGHLTAQVSNGVYTQLNPTNGASALTNEQKRTICDFLGTTETTNATPTVIGTWTPPISDSKTDYAVIVRTTCFNKSTASTRGYTRTDEVILVHSSPLTGTVAAASNVPTGGSLATAATTISAGTVVVTGTGEGGQTYEWSVYIEAIAHKFDRV